MQEEEKKQAAANPDEEKKEEAKSHASTKIEFVEPPKIATQTSVDSAINVPAVNSSIQSEADVEMTDE